MSRVGVHITYFLDEHLALERLRYIENVMCRTQARPTRSRFGITQIAWHEPMSVATRYLDKWLQPHKGDEILIRGISFSCDRVIVGDTSVHVESLSADFTWLELVDSSFNMRHQEDREVYLKRNGWTIESR
jgi:hypothetical protein